MSARSGRRPLRRLRLGGPLQRTGSRVVIHQRPRTGKLLRGEELPSPAQLGVGSALEVKIYLVLKRHSISFRIQQSFDGGSAVAGGQRADFVLPGYGGFHNTGTIVEALGPWHDLPGAAMRDDRKWEARRREGWNLVTIKESEATTLAQCERILMERLGTPTRSGNPS
jgi:hypothetical protein